MHMGNSRLRTVAVAVFVLSGCAPTAPLKTSPGPNRAFFTQSNQTCLPERPVTLNQFNKSGSTATIEVNPGQREFPRTGAGIRWQFSGNSLSFTYDGINFAKQQQQPAGPVASGYGKDATEFVVCFGDTSSMPNTTWRYNIKFFENSNPSVVWLCDPTLVNSGGESGGRETVTCKQTN